MDIFKVKGMHVDGVCACVPEIRLDNETELSKLYDSDIDKVVKSTGIYTRYVAKKGTSTVDLCLACAQKLMDQLKVDPEDIGGVIFVTFTPDRLMPFNASAIQQRLGLPKEIPAFDMSLACSGYAYGVYMASLLAQACGRKILLLDGDIQSAYMSEYDKATVPVMADAGSATLLSYDSALDDEWKFTFYTDGCGREVLQIPAGGSRQPICESDLKYQELEDGSKRRNIDIYMDGFEIYRFVAQDISKWLITFLEKTGESSETIDSFIPHQANMYMIKQLARKLKFSWEHTWKSGDEVGNSASATIPVTIAKNAKGILEQDVTGRQRVLVSGFGGGLSASAGVISLDKDAYFELFQYGASE